jgi:tyrosyl-tRNA synthetase
VPLIVDKATGKKFGKSEGNAVWLDTAKTSPYTFYQFWLNVTDINVGDYLKLFTFLPLTEITELMTTHDADPARRQAQRMLAKHVTTFVHGEENALAVENVSKILFEGGDLQSLSQLERKTLLENAPVFKLENAVPVVDLLVACGLSTSKREAREFIESGAITFGDEKVVDESLVIQLAAEEMKPLRRGKKNFVILYT